VLTNPTNVGSPKTLVNVREAALRYGIDVTVAEVTRREEFDAAFARLKAARTDALYVAIDSVIFVNAAVVLEFAAVNRLPASFDVGGRELVRRGALMSYGPVLTTHFAIAAEYVDKILRGARPGDLPVQQPTEFALFINSKTAAALGIAIPQSLLQRADEIVG
jgi:putative ABC transport system substrate-binding protein